MRICQISILNYRGIQAAIIPIPAHCAILGPNNCGKSTIANAMSLLFSRDRWYQNISEYDFFGGNPDAASRFTIIGVITGLNTATQSPVEVPDLFEVENGAIPVWWSEKETILYHSNPPGDAELAYQIAVTGRYNEDLCEFETRKYFYDGPTDPFALDPYIPLPNKWLNEIGFYFIPNMRQWDTTLTFGSGQFLKLLRELTSIPSEQINAYKAEMRDPVNKIEEADAFKGLLTAVEGELQRFTLLPENSNIVYRSTQLSVRSILESLIPLVKDNNALIPLARQGAGFVSIQLLLILLEFAKQRGASGQNTIFLAEEPELHLQASLQRRLISRLRGASQQTIVTTHSQHVASMFKPSEVIYLTNNNGIVASKVIYSGDIHSSPLHNQIRKLYLDERESFYKVLLGQYVIVPEGKWDWQWLHLLIRLAETRIAEDPKSVGHIDQPLTAMEINHTTNSMVVEFVAELRRFKQNVFALVDGDQAGRDKVRQIIRMEAGSRPKAIIQYGNEGEVEDLVAWMLEPALNSPGTVLSALLSDKAKPWGIQTLRERLKEKTYKDDWELHENLAWEAYDYPECLDRVTSFLYDLSNICNGNDPKINGWGIASLGDDQIKHYTAGFIQGA